MDLKIGIFSLPSLQTIMLDGCLLTLPLLNDMNRAYKLALQANSPASLQTSTDIVLSRPSLPYRRDQINLTWDDEIPSVASLRLA